MFIIKIKPGENMDITNIQPIQKAARWVSSFTAFVIIVFLINGCSDDTTTNPGGPPSGDPIISGTITNYPGGSIIAKARLQKSTPTDSFFAGTDTVDNNGVLAMNLLTPPTDFLTPFGVQPGITVSDTTTRINSFSALRAYNFSNAYIGSITYKNFDDTIVAGSFAVGFAYSTKPVTITGADTSINLLDTNIVAYNLSFTAGWNVFTTQLVEERPNFIRYEVRSGSTAGGSWRYEAVTLDLFIYRDFLRIQ
jgi:hypothetical protein